MLTFFPDHPKTKKMSKYADKKLPFAIRYVPDRLRLNKYVIKPLIVMLMH